MEARFTLWKLHLRHGSDFPPEYSLYFTTIQRHPTAWWPLKVVVFVSVLPDIPLTAFEATRILQDFVFGTSPVSNAGCEEIRVKIRENSWRKVASIAQMWLP